MAITLLIVSVDCNLWFLSLLFYDRTMGTKIVRFFKGIVRVWRLLGETEKGRQTAHVKFPTNDSDIMGKSRFKMTSIWTNAVISMREVTIPGKGIELSEEEAASDDGNRKAISRPVQVPDDKLEETFMNTPPEETEYGEGEPEDDTPDAPRVSGGSFDEIDDAARTVRSPEATHREREKAVKVLAGIEGTELYDKTMKSSLEIAVRIKELIEIRMKKPKGEFVVPDNTEDFNIRNYV